MVLVMIDVQLVLCIWYRPLCVGGRVPC